MKILYGVVGEGMGHAIRSSVVIDHLLQEGHEIHIVVSGRAYDFLMKRFEGAVGVTEIWGLTMVNVDNELRHMRTAAENIMGARMGLPGNVRRYFEVLEEEFRPEVVVSDFETWSWLFGKVHRLPIICIDNIQIINRCWHEGAILTGFDKDFLITKSVVKARAPRASHYLITTFFYPKVRKKRTTLVPPILRESILEAQPVDGEHLLVYQTSESFDALVDTLRALDRPCKVYGLRRDLIGDEIDGNITFRPFSEEGFVDDLRSCAGVIASAGFTLLGEALHLGKPYLATPVRKQFEQVLNARYLEVLNYGMYDERLDAPMIEAFVNRLPRYREALQRYPRQDNSKLFAELDDLLDRAAAGLLKGRR